MNVENNSITSETGKRKSRDLNDLAQAGELPGDLLTLCDIVHKASAVAVAIPDGKPIIKISTELHRNVDEAEAVLGKDSTLYQRDGQLVRLVRVAKSEATASVLEGTPTIRIANAATIKETLAKHAQWLRYDARADDWLPALPTRDVVEALMARGQYPHVRPITGIVESPMWLGDNRIMQEAGYDSSTGYVYAPTADFPMVPEAPSEDDCNGASALLGETWKDFPWRSESDRAVVVALLMSMLCRPAVGDVPAFALDATTPGSGKGLAIDAACCIATGRRANKQTYAYDAIEQEKILGAMAMRSANHVAFDDIKEPFGGSPLCKVLTCGGATSSRILGRSEVSDVPWVAIVTVTGNNIELMGDIPRRVVMARLEPTEERPELRSDFEHPKLLDWVLAHRAELVVAALTLVRAWYLAGKPSMGLPTLGSFEVWAELVPRVCVWAGLGNPLECCPSNQEIEDPEKVAIKTVMMSWNLFAPKGDTIKTIVNRLWPPSEHGEAHMDGHDDVREAMLLLAPPKRDGGIPDSRTLGSVFDKYKGRIISGMKFSARSGMGGIKIWNVDKLIKPAVQISGISGIKWDIPRVRAENVKEGKTHDTCDISREGMSDMPLYPTNPTAEQSDGFECVSCLTGRCFIHRFDES